VRPCDTAEQRLRMGTNQYRSGCRNAAANPNRVANSCVKRYAMRADNANAYSEYVAYTYCYSYSYRYDTAIPDADTERYHTAHSYTDGNGHRHSPAEGNT
jgi:hypothetical protein